MESKLLELLRQMSEGAHTEEIAAQMGIMRHTAAKYLEILRAKGLVRCRKVGNAKLWQPIMAGLAIRPLILEDLPAILELQSQLQPMGEAARRAFAQTIEYHIEYGDAALRLGAELQGQLVGFIVGEIRVWEFGRGEHTGWIKALMVAPEYHRRGIGQQLGEALLEHFRSRGIEHVRTLVNWYAGDLLAYFRSLGFEVMPMLPLERNLKGLHSSKAEKTSVSKEAIEQKNGGGSR
jgi:ribosomal protein S18 acetylase RimI-like enzyme